ncbi:MAG: FtsQ-type POTRA domain-containing protein [Acidimicrobiales bacterium]
MTTTSPPAPPDTTSVDPRLRARRIAVARDAGRRRLHRLAILGVLLAVVVLVAVLARSPLVSVQTVDIDGAARTPGDAVTQAVGAVKGHPIYAVNAGAIQHRLEALPWVREAHIERHWPRTLRITITERVAVAVAPAADGSLRLLDAEGRVLDVAAAAPPGLVEVVGPIAPGAPGSSVDAAARGALQVAAALPPTLMGKVVQAEWNDRGEVRLGLAPRGRVLVGPPTQLTEKLLALDTLLSNVDPATIGEVDVRAPEAPTIRPFDATAAQP